MERRLSFGMALLVYGQYLNLEHKGEKLKSNEQLIQSLINKGVLKSNNIINAFLEIDRKDFVTEEYEDLAYVDTALPIGKGQTISQPYTVAFMLELLRPKEGLEVLDIGSGSGWTTALLSKVVGKEGSVHAVELLENLVKMGRENISKYDVENVSIAIAKDKLGIPGEKFDRILVSASADEFPEELLEQLKVGGVMVLPVKESIYEVLKNKDGSVEKKEHYGFVFVDLV